MIFTSEADVRRWVRDQFGKSVFWIEPSMGSTFGLPDVLLAWVCQLVPIELKFAKINRAGELKVAYRANQRKMVNRFDKLSIPFFSLTGVAGESYLMMRDEIASKHGTVEYASVYRSDHVYEMLGRRLKVTVQR